MPSAASSGSPIAMPSSAASLAPSSNALGFDLWRKLPAAGDAAISPASISIALAMVVCGARGATATQLTSAMHLAGADPAAWGDLGMALQDRGGELRIANRLFGEKTFAFEDAYMRVTTTAFHAPLEPVDYLHASEAARIRINAWVSDQTKQRINDLLEPGHVTPGSRLTLVNAIYFLADWGTAFPKAATSPATFTLGAGKTKQAPTMHLTTEARSGATMGVHAVELPYKGGELAMTVIVPDRADGLAALEQGLSNESLGRIDAVLHRQTTAVSLPRLTIDPPTSLSLAEALHALGVVDAFDEKTADFSGIARSPGPGRGLYIGDVIHKAFVKVDEKGTEAAAATAIVMPPGGPAPTSPFVVNADHPFLFVIREQVTGLVLFVARVVDPRS